MGSAARWLVLLAVVVGAGAAVAFAGDGPLAPKNLSIVSLGDGAAVLTEPGEWTDVKGGFEWQGLTLMNPTLVRGPVQMKVVAGTYVEVPKGHIMRVSWEPAVRGWRFVAVKGDSMAYFTNTSTWIREGQSITLTSGGDPYRAPSGYAPSGVPGLVGLPEVSGFRPYEDDQR